jgi:hypothetical protein
MGIWQHIHTVTTTDVSSDLGEFSEILDDVSVEMIPLNYQEVEPFKLHPTSMSYIDKNTLNRLDGKNTLNRFEWGYGSTFIPLPPQRFPQIWKSLLKS